MLWITSSEILFLSSNAADDGWCAAPIQPRINAGVGATDENAWKTGWTAGAGLEAKIRPNWSWKFEYLYADFSGGAVTYLIPA